MNKELIPSDVPYLGDILAHLPIDANEQGVADYINNTADFVVLNYRYEQYTFAYLGLHLLCMVYVYFSAWKISQINPKEYSDVISFAKTYDGDELASIESIFDYSKVPEKELPKIFNIIGLDKSQRENIKSLVEIRNDIAHATGESGIPNERSFAYQASTVHSFVKNIHKCMDKQIRGWFSDIAIRFANNEFEPYDKADDFIREKLVQDFNLSTKELLVCNEMSFRELYTANQTISERLKSFKQSLKSFCEDMVYISSVL